jgi:hypothetical protein
MPSINYQDEKRLLDYFLRRLEDRLAGRQETDVLRTQPSDHCQLGVLAPWSRQLEVEEQPDELVGESATTEPESAARAIVPAIPGAPNSAPEPNSETDSERAQPVEPFSVREDAGRRPPSSLGMAVAVAAQDGSIRLAVRARCVFYSRHFPDFAAQRAELGNRDPGRVVPGERPHVSLVEKFRRHTIDLPVIAFTLRPGEATSAGDQGVIQVAVDELIARLKADPTILRDFTGNRIVPITNLRDEASFEAYLQTLRGTPEVPAWRASVRLRARPTEHGLRIEVHLCNNSRRDLERPSNDQFSSFYDGEVSLNIERGTLVPIELLAVPADYQYDRSVFGLGRNAGVDISEDHKSIRTHSLASYEQPRMTTQERVVARYRDLADEPFNILRSVHQAMSDYAVDWRHRVIEGNSLGLDAGSLNACRKDLDAFEREIEGFEAGIAAMQTDPRLTTAFRAMNRAFSQGRHPAWRLFQIVFIVSQLPALVVREGITGAEWPAGSKHDWTAVLERADVLWFPTGGGKTEAYLGLVACAALYDRLRGKQHGVTAWLRFPLRMLSVQQLQRAVRVVWETELQRRELEKEHGKLGDPFSLGYFVGSSNTPNQFFNQWSFERLESNDRQRDRLLLVPDCPACGQEGGVAIQLDKSNQRVRHVCGHCNVELPVYVSDDEIYRFQPTLLVGTVDKIAAIGYQAKVATLWLGPQWRCPCPDHGYGNGDWCIKDCPTNPNSKTSPKPRRIPVPNRDPSPSLHIQDELHLLQEELGAFAGHYETMVRANEAAAAGKPAKIIAATATIAGYVHQVRQIYSVREVRRFPNRGYDLSQTFYSILERESPAPNAKSKTARMFAAFRPPFLRPADAAARCAEILHGTINELHGDLTQARRRIGLPDSVTDAEIRDLLSFYSRTLTYVGKRDSGVRIRQRLEQDSAREGSGLRPGETRDLNVDYLSAHSTLKEIAATVKKAEAATPWTDSDHLDATVATHVISHGVDVEYFNLMILERIPEQVADYIQVSSRSGRQHIGLVLSVLPRYSLRASSIYDRFTEFHRHLDRMVMPVPVNRFAKAASIRSFPGIFLGALYGRHLNTLPADKAQRLHLVRRAISGAPGPLTREGLHLALLQSYALGESRYDDSLETQMETSLQRDWDRFLLEARQVSHRELNDVFDPKPMSSLRDVDIPVPFRPDDSNMGYQDLIWFQQPES